MTDPTRERCQWECIAQCPLYIASHEGHGFGCVDDLARPCMVQRGEMNYHTELQNLIRHGLGLDYVPPAGRA